LLLLQNRCAASDHTPPPPDSLPASLSPYYSLSLTGLLIIRRIP
jgi:hypothetical protein